MYYNKQLYQQAEFQGKGQITKKKKLDMNIVYVHQKKKKHTPNW